MKMQFFQKKLANYALISLLCIIAFSVMINFSPVVLPLGASPEFLVPCFFVIWIIITTHNRTSTDRSTNNTLRIELSQLALVLLLSTLLFTGLDLINANIKWIIFTISFFVLLIFSSLVIENRLDIDFSKLHSKKIYILVGTIFILALLLRLHGMDYVQGADNFNLIAGKSLYETGHFVYQRNLDITFLIAFLFKIFSPQIEVARLVPLFWGMLSVLYLYRLGSKVSWQVGILSSLLLATSPVAIEKSLFIREYSFLLFMTIFITDTLLTIFNKYLHYKELFVKKYLTYAFSLSLFFLIYSYLVDTGTIKSALSTIFFMSFPIAYYFIQEHYQAFLPKFYLISAFILAIFLAIVAFPITMFSKTFTFVPFWFDMFFNPNVSTPMQWFSQSFLPTGFFFILWCISFFYTSKNLKILNFIFLATIFLFVFKYEQTDKNFTHSRYLYYIYPFYIVGFATSLHLIYKSLSKLSHKGPILFLSSLVALLMMNPLENIAHGAKHDLSIWDGSSTRQPTAASSLNIFKSIVDILKSNGATDSSIFVIQGESPALLTWYMNIRVERTYTNKSGDIYETGKGVYVVDEGQGVDEMTAAFSDHESGYLIWHSSRFKESDFSLYDKSISYIDTIGGYKLYFWSSASPNSNVIPGEQNDA